MKNSKFSKLLEIIHNTLKITLTPTYTCSTVPIFEPTQLVHLRLIKSFLNSQTEHDVEMKLTPIDFSHGVAEASRSSCLQTLGNQLIKRSPYIN